MLLQVKTVDKGWEVWAQVEKFHDEGDFVTIIGRVLEGRPEFVFRQRVYADKPLEWRVTDGTEVKKESHFPWKISGVDFGQTNTFQMTMYMP